MTIKAIETHYKGYRFRSRLEARWAVFFDALPKTRWTWRYETEGYDMYGIRYLPDFELTIPPYTNATGEVSAHSFFLEIKGKPLSADEWNKSVMFAAYLKRDIYIFQGEVGLGCNISWISSLISDMPEYLWDTKAIPPFMCSEQMHLMQCDYCKVVDLWFLDNGFIDGFPTTCNLCGEGEYQTETDGLYRAEEAARSARFEHGETPRVPRGKPR